MRNSEHRNTPAVRTTPLQRATRHLRALGYFVERVRRRAGCQDTPHRLFGFADLLAIKEGQPMLAVLVSKVEWGGLYAQRNVAAGLPELRAWVASGGQAEAWGWQKRRHRWHLVRLPIRPADGELPLQVSP
jgi:hypothetical protein